jgi:hypothetical protein
MSDALQGRPAHLPSTTVGDDRGGQQGLIWKDADGKLRSTDRKHAIEQSTTAIRIGEA